MKNSLKGMSKVIDHQKKRSKRIIFNKNHKEKTKILRKALLENWLKHQIKSKEIKVLKY